MPNRIDKYQLDKLGNTLIFLSENVGDFNKTKALKLLFLLEETSIKQFGAPFFGFDFKVWKFGPVLEEVFRDLDEEDTPLLNDYIKRVNANKEEFEPARKFDDDEFSNNDIGILQTIIQVAKHKTARDLVNITHRKGSLWDQKVVEYNLRPKFDSGAIITTNILIDFCSVFNNQDAFLKEKYENSLDFIKFNSLLKA